MVRGIEKFREYFGGFTDQYIIIGGLARDYAMFEAGFEPKGTKDIDVVLVIEALSREFVIRFWEFIKSANYRSKEADKVKKKYYRFTNPEQEDFPAEIELFSRKPDTIQIPVGINLTPIPADGSLSNLSAIMLNDEYYKFILSHCTVHEGLPLANTEALICFKAIAWLDLTERKEKGDSIDSRKINKHKTDIFWLGSTLAPADVFDLPDPIKSDLQRFINQVKYNLPGKAVLKNMDLRGLTADQILLQLIKSFQLDE